MTAPDLKRFGGPILLSGMAVLLEHDDGEYVRFADAQAAIAAAMMGAVEPIIAEHLTYDSIAKGGHVNEELAKLAGAIATVLDRVSKAQYATIPTDAMAALAKRDKQVQGEALEKAALFFDEMFKPKIAAMLRDMKGGE